MHKSRKIAIIGCGPPNHTHMYKGKKRSVGEMIAHQITEKSAHKASVHEPPENIRDFPDVKAEAIIIPGSSYNWDNESIVRNDWMKKLLDFIRSVHGKKPILGICFGHQAIALAFGSHILRLGDDVVAEVGAHNVSLTAAGTQDAIFKGVPEQFAAMFSHSFYVQNIPENGVLLAKNDIVEVQGFRLGENTYGVQFHPDYDSEIMSQVVKGDKIKKARNPDEIKLAPETRLDRLVLDNFFQLVAML
jgi:GMP synthase-like glutamine amidotransferase